MITYLKIIVIVLGVMIAAGLVVIGIKLVEKSGELAELSEDDSETAADDWGASALSEASAPVPTPADLGMPAGSQVRRMTAAGHRLILVVAVPDQGERIVIVDLRNGGTVANIGLEGTP